MNIYLSNFIIRTKSLLQYRTAAWAGFGTQFFFGLVRIMIFFGFYSANTSPQPLNLDQVVDYMWLGQAFFAIIPIRQDAEIAHLIKNGDIAYELVRPIHLFYFWFTRQLAGRIIPTFLRGTPLIITASIVLHLCGFNEWALSGPASISYFLLFVLAEIFAFILASLFCLLISLTLFWTFSSQGFDLLITVIIWTFCGLVIPLPFYPDWLRFFVYLLPFRGIMDIPIQLYLGIMPFSKSLAAIGLQIFWIILF